MTETQIKVSSCYHRVLHSFDIINVAQFFVDDDDDDGSVAVSHNSPEDHHPTPWIRAEDEAAWALRQAQAITQRHDSQREVSLPASELDSEPMRQAAQQNMDMYCIEVPVRSSVWHII